MKKDYKIVEVEWIDSCSNDRWMYLEDLDFTPIHCKSSGYLIKDEDDYIIIANSVGKNDDGECNQCCGMIAIPRAAILNFQVIIDPELRVSNPHP